MLSYAGSAEVEIEVVTTTTTTKNSNRDRHHNILQQQLNQIVEENVADAGKNKNKRKKEKKECYRWWMNLSYNSPFLYSSLVEQYICIFYIEQTNKLIYGLCILGEKVLICLCIANL